MTQPTRILILGGGFAGVYTGMYLEQLAARHKIPLELTIVNRENYMVFQPLLPDVISGAIETLHVVTPIRRMVRSARLVTREILAIDLEQRTATVGPGFLPEHLKLEYDHLVIGLGTILDCARVPGMSEHGLPFKHLGDALRLRNHIVEVLEEADVTTDPIERQRLLTFIVGGGGFSGVECMAELNDFVSAAIRTSLTIKPQECRFVLVQGADRILPEVAPGLAQFAHDILTRRGIQIRLNTRVVGVSATAATLWDTKADAREMVASRTSVVTAPAAPHPIVSSLKCKLERGRIAVNGQLAVDGQPNVWAVGDCAMIPQGDGQFSPPTAQHATRQAKTCAQNIIATIQGKPLTTFNFPGLGKLGSLGRGQAVAEVFGFKISGILAWLLWRGVYLSKLPGLDRKIRVMFDWCCDLFLPRDITQLRIFPDKDLRREHFEAGQTVFERGDVGDKLYFVVDGEAEVALASGETKVFKQGDMFGEWALVDHVPRSATVRARTQLNVVSMSREAFEYLITHLPGMRERIEAVVAKYAEELPRD
jgi:NADH dehydrogenase